MLMHSLCNYEMYIHCSSSSPKGVANSNNNVVQCTFQISKLHLTLHEHFIPKLKLKLTVTVTACQDYTKQYRWHRRTQCTVQVS
jgi:hypothetical protein